MAFPVVTVILRIIRLNTTTKLEQITNSNDKEMVMIKKEVASCFSCHKTLKPAHAWVMHESRFRKQENERK